ncbi:MAG: hypothetical protein IJG13_21365 [Kiritimatiellae bacterium]|nr:hypothetical protein [Kiritimatiellia bacterium]
MKKLLSIAVCASAVAAFATTNVTCGTVGVTAITSTYTNTVVAVSYKELGNLDSDITVSNIVKTANLSNGDLLYVFSGGKYQSYTLTTAAGGAKYWDRTLDYVVGANGQLTTDETPAANIATLASGSGIWLVRPNGWDGANFTFYIYGKPSGVTSVKVAAGATALVGNPTQTNKAPTISGATSGDQILVPANNKVGMQTYSYSGSVWLTRINKAWQEGLPTINAGTGFWYVAKGAVTINW